MRTGTCGEVFGRLGQVGSFASGMFEAYCKLLSTALQFGVPLKEVVKGFRNYSFEPSGFCRVGDDTDADTCTEIRSCASVVDLIAKILAWLFPESNGYRLRDVFSIPSVSLPGQSPDTTVSVLPPRIITTPAHKQNPVLPEIPAGKAPEGTMLNGASLCPQCHSPGLRPGRQVQILPLCGLQGRRLRGIKPRNTSVPSIHQAESGLSWVPPSSCPYTVWHGPTLHVQEMPHALAALKIMEHPQIGL